jgi:hypothetical protein
MAPLATRIDTRVTNARRLTEHEREIDRLQALDSRTGDWVHGGSHTACWALGVKPSLEGTVPQPKRMLG